MPWLVYRVRFEPQYQVRETGAEPFVQHLDTPQPDCGTRELQAELCCRASGIPRQGVCVSSCLLVGAIPSLPLHGLTPSSIWTVMPYVFMHRMRPPAEIEYMGCFARNALCILVYGLRQAATLPFYGHHKLAISPAACHTPCALAHAGLAAHSHGSCQRAPSCTQSHHAAAGSTRRCRMAAELAGSSCSRARSSAVSWCVASDSSFRWNCRE